MWCYERKSLSHFREDSGAGVGETDQRKHMKITFLFRRHCILITSMVPRLSGLLRQVPWAQVNHDSKVISTWHPIIHASKSLLLDRGETLKNYLEITSNNGKFKNIQTYRRSHIPLHCTPLRLITYLLVSIFIGREVMPFTGPTKKL